MSRRAFFRAAALADLRGIAEWIAAESGSKRIAETFVTRLRDRCDAIAGLPGTLGQLRDDLGPDLRGVSSQGYLILFRYAGDRFEVVRILHGRRDLPNVVTPDPET